MNIGKFFKNLFSSSNVKAAEVYAVSEVSQLANILAPTLLPGLTAMYTTLRDTTQPNSAKLFALADEAISLALSLKGVTLNKTVAIAAAQEVVGRIEADAKAVAITALSKL